MSKYTVTISSMKIWIREDLETGELTEVSQQTAYDRLYIYYIYPLLAMDNATPTNPMVQTMERAIYYPKTEVLQ